MKKAYQKRQPTDVARAIESCAFLMAKEIFELERVARLAHSQPMSYEDSLRIGNYLKILADKRPAIESAIQEKLGLNLRLMNEEELMKLVNGSSEPGRVEKKETDDSLLTQAEFDGMGEDGEVPSFDAPEDEDEVI